jgi:hypothetical protein
MKGIEGAAPAHRSHSFEKLLAFGIAQGRKAGVNLQRCKAWEW